MKYRDTYLQYGIPSDWAESFDAKGISVAAFKKTSAKMLQQKFAIPAENIAFVKACLTRKPIDRDELETLLNNNRFVCCVCRGTKGQSYIVHHIIPYAQTQDNSYDNLAVLCPVDHDLVHREGTMLTQKITPDQVRKAKYKWEQKVEEMDAQAASAAGDLYEVDFINVPHYISSYFTTRPRRSTPRSCKKIN